MKRTTIEFYGEEKGESIDKIKSYCKDLGIDCKVEKSDFIEPKRDIPDYAYFIAMVADEKCLYTLVEVVYGMEERIRSLEKALHGLRIK